MFFKNRSCTDVFSGQLTRSQCGDQHFKLYNS